MSEQTTAAPPALAAHGSAHLPAVVVDSYNVELKDENGFLGDRASKGAFRDILEKWRKPLREAGEDPFGKEPTDRKSTRLNSSHEWISYAVFCLKKKKKKKQTNNEVQ